MRFKSKALTQICCEGNALDRRSVGKEDEYVMLSGYFCTYYAIDLLSSPRRLRNTHKNYTGGWDPRICFTKKQEERVNLQIENSVFV